LAIKSAVKIALDLGMSKSVVGLTIVAFGTSVPELVTSAVAAFRKETDISIGNLIGSNIFNIMAVIGITAMVKPINVDKAVISYDMLWMLGISAMLLPLMLVGKKLDRYKGFMLFSTYIIYIILVVMAQKS
jgi:cation:H+ antiporter